MKRFVFFYYLIFICQCIYGQELKNDIDFLVKIKELKHGHESMVLLDKSDSIKLVSLVLDKIDEKDKQYNNEFIELRKFKAINKESILAIDKNYILLILEESSGKLRAATFGINGKPIESILIYDNALFPVYEFREHESRRYSPTKKYHFNPQKKSFTFSSIMKTTEIILDGNEYKEIYLFDQDEEDETNNRQQVFINETGRFINYSHEHHTPPEINFGLVKLASNMFKEENATVVKTYDDDGEENYKIYLSRDKSAELVVDITHSEDLVMRMMMDEYQDVIDIGVFQQFKNILAINGDGDFCEIQTPFYQSDWDSIPLEYNVFSIEKISKEKQHEFIKFTTKEFKKKVKQECSTEHYNQIKKTKKNELKNFILTSEISIKVVIKKKDHTIEEYIRFILTNGC